MASVDPNENESEPEPGPDAEPAKNPVLTRRRDSKFRVDLIRRLPEMSYEKWSPKDSFRLDQEWGGVIEIQSNAILGPLEALAGKGRRGE